jgi:hypothetical protein
MAILLVDSAKTLSRRLLIFRLRVCRDRVEIYVGHDRGLSGPGGAFACPSGHCGRSFSKPAVGRLSQVRTERCMPSVRTGEPYAHIARVLP